MPVRALVEAGGYFGLGGNSVRVALARLVAQGRVDRDERGRYRQGAAASLAARVIRGWRRVDSSTRAWSGAWVAVQSLGSRSRAQKSRDEQVMRLFGFRVLDAGLSLRPDNRVGGVEETRRSLLEAGLASSSLVACMHDLGEELEVRTRGLWDVDELKAQYQETVQALLRSERSLKQASSEKAMAETFRVGGRAIRQLVLDPLLPKEMFDPELRSTLVSTMIEYDRFGRAFWAPFMRRHGVVPRRARVSLPFEAAAGIDAEIRVGAEAI